MTPTEYLRVFARFWWVIVVCVLAGASFPVVIDEVSTTPYSATSNVLISANATAATTSSEAYTSTLTAQARMASYANIARGSALTAGLVDELGLDLTPRELADKIKVVVPDETLVLAISVQDTDPELAQRIAAAVAERVVETVGKLESSRGGGRALLRANLVGEPTPATATPPPTWRNPVVGAAGGLVIGLGLAVLIGKVRRRVRDESDVSNALECPLLGVLPLSRSRKPSGPGGISRDSRRAEAVRELRTSIFFMHPGPDGCLSVTLTSPRPVERLEEIGEDLATALVDAGARVLLVGGDLHESHRGTLLAPQAEQSVGLAGYLDGSGALDGAIRHDSSSGVDVLPAGSTLTNPADLLHVHALAALVAYAASRYDFVLITAPATSVGTDAAALAARCDGALLFIERGRTSETQLHEATSLLLRVGATVLGAVLVS